MSILIRISLSRRSTLHDVVSICVDGPLLMRPNLFPSWLYTGFESGRDAYTRHLAPTSLLFSAGLDRLYSQST